MTTFDPFDDLLRTLQGELPSPEAAGIRIDETRRSRTGAPEVIYCKGKASGQIVVAIERLLSAEGRALATRLDPLQAPEVTRELDRLAVRWVYDPDGLLLSVRTDDAEWPEQGGRAGILTAGSSDRPVAAEAAAVLAEMGCETRIAHDVGVAGLHRLVEPLRHILRFDPDVLIVVAGMDGILPGVVSGLVSIPVIGVPTSTGYGFGGEGLGALTTMLQTCAPGVAVVNIDNGIGAGITAGLIANRASSQRSAYS